MLLFDFLTLRYIPNNVSLGITELDEKHVSVFNFRNREGLINLVSTPNSLDKVRATLSAQICQKFLLMSAVQQVNGSYNEIRSEEKGRLKIQKNNLVFGSSRSSSSNRSLIRTSLPSQLSKCHRLAQWHIIKLIMLCRCLP